jgi:Cohesin domain
MKKYRIASSVPLIFLAALLLTPSAVLPAHSAITGTVCIADGSSTTCPSSPLTFTGSTGTQLTVAVNIQGSDTFNGIDIHVKTDPTVLNPVSVNTETNSVLAANSQFGLYWFGCLNGTPTNASTGNVCQSGLDGPGVVHIVATALGGSVPAPATGRLFAITFNVVSGSATATIGFPTAPPGTTGCDPSSVQGTTTCVQVVFTSTIDPETVEAAGFNMAPPSPPPPPPTFSISASPSSLTVKGESSKTSTITLQSLNGFIGTITLSATVSPIVKNGLSAALSPTSVSLTANGQATSTLTATANGPTPMGTYTVTVTASGGGVTKQTQVTVTVTAG